MKKYVFPYGGSFGKGDSWDGENEFELTDEEASRLEASARKEPRWHLDEDPEIEDIYDKVYAFLYNHDVEQMLNDKYMMQDLRADHGDEYKEVFDEEKGEYVELTDSEIDRKLVEEYMDGTTFHVCYPEELQDLEDNPEDEEE